MRKTECKECKYNLCIHERRKNECKDCKGASICEHGRRRRECIDCGGSSICEHKTLRRRCKQCKGSSICEHNRRKNECRECVGTSVCVHNKLRRHCVQCGGASICVHNRRRNICKDCGGSSICSHGRRKGRCRDCKEAQAVKSEPQSPLETPLTPRSPPLTPQTAASSALPTPVVPAPSLAGLSQEILAVLGQQPAPPSGLFSPPAMPLGSFSALPLLPSTLPSGSPLLSSSLGAFALGKESAPASQGPQAAAALLALLNRNLSASASTAAGPPQPPTPPSPAELLRSNSLPALTTTARSLPLLPVKSHSFTGGSQQPGGAALYYNALNLNPPLHTSPAASLPCSLAGPKPEAKPVWSRPSSSVGPSANLFDLSVNSEGAQSSDVRMPDSAPGSSHPGL